MSTLIPTILLIIAFLLVALALRRAGRRLDKPSAPPSGIEPREPGPNS
jgi:hypothetical protein